MPDEYSLTSRQADQLRTDIANVEGGLEVIMGRWPGFRRGRSCGAPS
jgi:hypothetical protein